MSTELEAIIKSAITQEELSHDFYKRLAGLVSHPETKDTLEYLAKEELEHKAFLQSCFTPHGCTLAGEAQNVHLAEMLEAPAISDDHVPQGGPGHRREAGGGGLPLLSGPGQPPAPGGGPGFPE